MTRHSLPFPFPFPFPSRLLSSLLFFFLLFTISLFTNLNGPSGHGKVVQNAPSSTEIGPRVVGSPGAHGRDPKLHGQSDGHQGRPHPNGRPSDERLGPGQPDAPHHRGREGPIQELGDVRAVVGET